MRIVCFVMLSLVASSSALAEKKRSSAAAAEEKLAPALEPLRQRFTIADAHMGKASGFGTHGEKGWSAKLTSPALGPLEVSLFLPMHGDTLASPAPFLRDVDDLAARIRHVAWVLRYFSRHRDARLTIFYFEDRSLSAATKAELAKRIHAEKMVSDEATVLAALDHALAFQLETGTFIVLPDGHTYIDADVEPGVLYDAVVGRIVDIDGKLIP